MISTQLSTISHVVQGQLLGADSIISSVSTDTRRIEPEGLFIALVGERFDAHQFAQQAIDAGAKALMVERALDVDVAQIIVSNTKQALGQLGRWVHQQCQTPTIAITGSCGKTTVKEMVASILSMKGQVLYTAGNFNNDIGVPLTLLRSTPVDDFAVIELGANHIGEIAYTTRLVQPDVALVNNVAAAHLEGFGSIDGVKQAKGEIYQGLAPGKTALINLDSHGGDFWREVLTDKQVKTFSTSQHTADFFATQIELNQAGEASFLLHSPQGTIAISLTLIGQHNVSNALAASALAMEMGASLTEIAAGLSHLSAVKGRVDVCQLTPTIRLIDDSYNASVPAMKSAIDLLASFSGCRWLILGNMAELGTESLALHEQVGKHAAPFQFEHVLTYGEDARVISQCCHGQHFATHQDMMTFIEQQLTLTATQEHVLLVKGANSSGMGQIVAALKEKLS